MILIWFIFVSRNPAHLLNLLIQQLTIKRELVMFFLSSTKFWLITDNLSHNGTPRKSNFIRGWPLDSFKRTLNRLESWKSQLDLGNSDVWVMQCFAVLLNWFLSMTVGTTLQKHSIPQTSELPKSISQNISVWKRLIKLNKS